MRTNYYNNHLSTASFAQEIQSRSKYI